MTDFNEDRESKLKFSKDLIEKGDNYGMYLLASIYKDMQDYTKAEPIFKQVIELEKKRIESLDFTVDGKEELIHNRFIIKEIKDNGTTVKRILEYSGQDEKNTLFLSYSGLGSLYVTHDKLLDAFDNFIAAQTLEPNLALFSFIFARLLYQTGHYEEAYAYLQHSFKADQIFPGKTTDYKRSLKADILIALGEYEHAIYELLNVFFGLLKKETNSKEESHRLTQLMKLMLQLFQKAITLSPPVDKSVLAPYISKHDTPTPPHILASEPKSMTDMYNQSEILNAVYNDIFYESGAINTLPEKTVASIRIRAHFLDYLYYSLRDTSALVLFKNPLLTIDQFEESLDLLSKDRKDVHIEQFKIYKSLFSKLV